MTATELLSRRDPSIVRLFLAWDRPDRFPTDFTQHSFDAFAASAEPLLAGVRPVSEPLDPALAAIELARGEAALRPATSTRHWLPAACSRCWPAAIDTGSLRAALTGLRVNPDAHRRDRRRDRRLAARLAAQRPGERGPDHRSARNRRDCVLRWWRPRLRDASAATTAGHRQPDRTARHAPRPSGVHRDRVHLSAPRVRRPRGCCRPRSSTRIRARRRCSTVPSCVAAAGTACPKARSVSASAEPVSSTPIVSGRPSYDAWPAAGPVAF